MHRLLPYEVTSEMFCFSTFIKVEYRNYLSQKDEDGRISLPMLSDIIARTYMK